jgi:toxin FitB
VVSELRKRARCDAGVAAWYERVPVEDIYLSVLTLGELRNGIESLRRRDPATAEVLGAWLDELVSLYADRLLPVDQDVAEQWGRLNVPDPLPVVDGLLAATAKVHGLTLVTRNVKDVERAQVDCLNPFSAPT